jgi:hypothetical protein
MHMMNKSAVWITVGVIGAVLVCSVIYISGITERPGFSDATLQTEPNDVATQSEPNQMTAQVEPNEVTPRTASIKDTFKDEPGAHAL